MVTLSRSDVHSVAPRRVAARPTRLHTRRHQCRRPRYRSPPIPRSQAWPAPVVTEPAAVLVDPLKGAPDPASMPKISTPARLRNDSQASATPDRPSTLAYVTTD